MGNFTFKTNADYLFTVNTWKLDTSISDRYDVNGNGDYRAFEKMAFSAPYYQPIHKMLFKFIRKQIMRQSEDVKRVSANGLFYENQNYKDYMNSVFVHLYEMCLENPNDDFLDTLLLATKDGIKEQWKNTHNRITAKIDGVEKEVVVRYEDIDEHFELYDKSQGYDYSIDDLENHIDNTNRIESALSNANDVVKEWCKKYADGMSFEQIGREYGKTKHAVRQAIKRLAD